ncbi:MAG: hypothetical protein OXG65_03965 [Chloroflexi bacterium]|nr:hypothetical protein [Chloroflexota bacterium]
MAGQGTYERNEFARRLRAYMGYADRTLNDVAQSLRALGVNASVSTINRWSRGLSVPNIVAAQALARMVEDAGMVEPGEGMTWLLGEGRADPAGSQAQAILDLDHSARSWQFHTASPALAQALAERGVPAAYRQPLVDLLAQLLAEIEPDQPDSPLADEDAAD